MSTLTPRLMQCELGVANEDAGESNGSTLCISQRPGVRGVRGFVTENPLGDGAGCTDPGVRTDLLGVAACCMLGVLGVTGWYEVSWYV